MEQAVATASREQTVAPTAAPSRTTLTPHPSVPEVRGQIPGDLRTRSILRGSAVFTVSALAYAVTFWLALAAPWWPLQILAALINGLFIAQIFTIGHDACHGSLTSSDPLNKVLGRLAFLPSLTPYVSWEYAHNRIHHSYTNWRGKDYAWAPFSKDEYDRLSPLRRLLERHYRSIWGIGHYYLIEYWWKHLLFPPRDERRDMKRPLTFLFDRLLVAAFLGLQIAVILWWSASQPEADGFWSNFTAAPALLATVLVVPFLVWNYGMSFAIFQHHNHPRVCWFDNKEEWDFFAGQVESTTHIVLPWYLEWISGHIMQHTAHHVDSKIPLYHLTESQSCLEGAYPRDIVVEQWTFTTLGKTLARCKLYDYENHRWLNFKGRPTTEPNEKMRQLREAARA